MNAIATAKSSVLEAVSQMCDDVSYEDIIEAIGFRSRIDEAIRQLDNGEGIPHAVVCAEFSKWLN